MERRRSSIPFICFLAPDFLSGRGIWRSMAGEEEGERERMGGRRDRAMGKWRKRYRERDGVCVCSV